MGLFVLRISAIQCWRLKARKRNKMKGWVTGWTSQVRQQKKKITKYNMRRRKWRWWEYESSLLLVSSFVFFSGIESVGQALCNLWICLRTIWSHCFIACLLPQVVEHWWLNDVALQSGKGTGLRIRILGALI